MYVFFDTETTGKFDFKASSNTDHQPYIAELAAVLTDKELSVQGTMNVLIRPDGWEIPEEVTAITGITTEQCKKYGVPFDTAIQMFADLAYTSSGEEPTTFVAHNIKFDIGMISRLPLGIYEWILERPKYCTMEESTNICKLPPTERMKAVGFGHKHKPPTLGEAYKYFEKEEFKGAHRALSDVKACMAVFSHLKNIRKK